MKITSCNELFEELESPVVGNHLERRPILDILGGQASTPGKDEFCYQVAKRTVVALLERKYSEFDAQTTSNCCHGMSVLVRELICSVKGEDLAGLLQVLSQRIDGEQIDPQFSLPAPLIDLCHLYILNYVRYICPEKGMRTSAARLKDIGQLGRTLCGELVKNLQRAYSNRVACRYAEYSNLIPQSMKICDVPLSLWAKYISPSYLRTSSQGTYFASCLYSMQVTLAYLIFSESKIAVINDIYDSQEKLSKRYVKILQGNGIDGFGDVAIDLMSDEPVIVFGGCAYHDCADKVGLQMDYWMSQFPNLVLACDTFYPQFPKVCDDPRYQHSAIVPSEPLLQKVIHEHHQLSGVSASNPHFYCLNHIYPSSVQQIMSNQLPSYKIPKILLKSELAPSP